MGVKGRLGRFALRITYARVIVVATALVLLGGGYSMALSGTGTLQKENEIGVPGTGDPVEVIRTVRGIGEITAFDCDDSSPPAVTSIGFKNTSGETLRVWIDQALETGGPTEDPLALVSVTHGSHVELFGTGITESARVHIFPADGSKAPQAKALIGHLDALTCDAVQISVLSLSTQE